MTGLTPTDLSLSSCRHAEVGFFLFLKKKEHTTKLLERSIVPSVEKREEDRVIFDLFYFRVMSSGDSVCLLLMEEIVKIPSVENVIQNSQRFMCSLWVLAHNPVAIFLM